MDFSFSQDQVEIRGAIDRICEQFDVQYWLERDDDGRFPHELHQALARDGWLGICIPEAYGGSGLGVTEATIMMQAISESGAGMSGASAVHMNIFGLNPVVQFATEEQKHRMLRPLIAGDEKACFAVTEPNTGLNTTQLKVKADRRGDHYIVRGTKVWISTAQVADKMLLLARTTPLEECRSHTDGLSLFYTDVNREYVQAREIPKMGRKAVDSNELFIDDLPVPVEDLIGEGGQGLWIHHARHERRAHSDCRRGDWLGTCGAKSRIALRQGARGV